MAKRFKVGDHVTWNSEAGHVSGRNNQVPSATSSSCVPLADAPADNAQVRDQIAKDAGVSRRRAGGPP